MFCLRTRPTNLELDAKNIYLCIATGIYIKKLSLSFYIGVGSWWGHNDIGAGAWCSSATESPVVKIELKT